MALMDFFRRKKTANMAGVYALIVKQARLPALFGDNGAPDSFDGRFDIMVLHVHLVLHITALHVYLVLHLVLHLITWHTGLLLLNTHLIISICSRIISIL